MTDACDLSGCWAKIERAKEHRDALDVYIQETFAVEANRPRIGTKFEAETGEHIIFVNHLPDLHAFFDRVSIVLGDVVHNLRCSLDHLVFQLAVDHTKGHVRHVRNLQFPIAASQASFQQAQRQNLGELHPDSIAVLERFQPYNRLYEQELLGHRFHPLATLRDLSNTDKHRLLTTVIIPATGVESDYGATIGLIYLFGFQQDGLIGMRETDPVAGVGVKLGTELVRAKLPVGTLRQENVDMAGYVASRVALNDGKPVIAVIDRMAEVVVKLLRAFDPVSEPLVSTG